MKIVIDLTPLYGRKKTGVEMYAIDLYKALLSSVGNNLIPVFHVCNELDENPNAYVIPKSNRFILENYKVSMVIRKIKPDVAIFPIFSPPIDLYNSNIKIIPTVHDLVSIKFRNTLNFTSKYYGRPKRVLSIKKSNAIITISETIKSELNEITTVPIINLGENISEDFIKAKQIANESLLKKWELKKDKYIVSVSTIEPRKNLKYLILVFKKFLLQNDFKLVLVGRRGWGKDQKLNSLIEELGNLIVFTEYVSMNELFTLYKYAYAFSLLSIYEGFGRPPFEAAACGVKRIVLSDIPIFHETFENQALFLPLNDIDTCEKILKLGIPITVSEDIIIPYHYIQNNINKLFEYITEQ